MSLLEAAMIAMTIPTSFMIISMILSPSKEHTLHRSFIAFHESIMKDDYTVEKRSDITIKVPGSDWSVSITTLLQNKEWYCYYCNGIVFDFELLPNGQIENLNMKQEFITEENAEEIHMCLSQMITKIKDAREEINKKEKSIQAKFTNIHKKTFHEQAFLSKIIKDKEIEEIIEKINDIFHYIEPKFSSFSLEKQHHFERIQNKELPELLQAFADFATEEQVENKASLLTALESLLIELDLFKQEIKANKKQAYEKRLALIEQRK